MFFDEFHGLDERHAIGGQRLTLVPRGHKESTNSRKDEKNKGLKVLAALEGLKLTDRVITLLGQGI